MKQAAYDKGLLERPTYRQTGLDMLLRRQLSCYSDASEVHVAYDVTSGYS